MTKFSVIDTPEALNDYNLRELRERCERATRRVAEVERQLRNEYNRGYADGCAAVTAKVVHALEQDKSA